MFGGLKRVKAQKGMYGLSLEALSFGCVRALSLQILSVAVGGSGMDAIFRRAKVFGGILGLHECQRNIPELEVSNFKLKPGTASAKPKPVLGPSHEYLSRCKSA